jgi:hypothetical protein
MGASLIPRWVVVEVFKKYHSGLTDDNIYGDRDEIERMAPGDSSFWEKWKPRKFVLDMPT